MSLHQEDSVVFQCSMDIGEHAPRVCLIVDSIKSRDQAVALALVQLGNVAHVEADVSQARGLCVCAGHGNRFLAEVIAGENGSAGMPPPDT